MQPWFNEHDITDMLAWERDTVAFPMTMDRILLYGQLHRLVGNWRTVAENLVNKGLIVVHEVV
jgi:hypothetical protein